MKPVTVDLMNEGGGLGFGIVDTSCGSVVIKTIVTDGPAFNVTICTSFPGNEPVLFLTLNSLNLSVNYHFKSNI